MNDDLSLAQKRSFQYWFIDGLAEIALGIYALVFSVYFYLQVVLQEGSFSRILLDSSFLLIFLGIWWGMGKAVQAVKYRLTYPRTGYIAYNKPKRNRRWAAAIVAMVISGAVTTLLLNAPKELAWMPIMTSVIVMGLLAAFGWRAGLVRFYILSGLLLVIGIALGFSKLENTLALSAFYLLLGILLLISGVWTLIRYLRKTPAAEEQGPYAG